MTSVPSPSGQPATFAERGVYWPGTTPALAGARVRRGVDGLEFVVPNPANGRGVYVLRWDAVRDTLQPTLHDTLLHNALRGAATVTPHAMRAVARQAALDGAAGRPARAAALRAGEAELRARDATARLILPAGWTGAGMSEALVDTVAAVGVGPSADTARLPRLLGQVAAFRDGMRAVGGDVGDSVAALADAVVAGGTALLDAARQQIGDIRALLAAWGAGASGTALAVTRPGWFLDGWEAPCLLWQDSAGPPDIGEVCALLPVLPLEAQSWVGRLAPLPAWAAPRAGADWRAGLAALDRQARHERLRALAA